MFNPGLSEAVRLVVCIQFIQFASLIHFIKHWHWIKVTLAYYLVAIMH